MKKAGWIERVAFAFGAIFFFSCGTGQEPGTLKRVADSLKPGPATTAADSASSPEKKIYYTTPFDAQCVEQVKILLRESAYHPVAELPKDSMQYWIDSYGDSVFVVRAYMRGDGDNGSGTFGWLELDLRGELRERGPNEDDPMKQIEFDREMLERLLERCH